MVINIIMAVCLYPVLFIISYVMKSPAKYENGLLFGVTMKKQWMQEQELKELTDALCRRYKKELRLWTLFCAVVPLVCFGIPYVSIQVTIWCTWIFVICALLMLPQIRAHRGLMQWKEEKGYLATEENHVVYVELREAGQIRRVTFSQYLIPILISAATVVSPLLCHLIQAQDGHSKVYAVTFFVLWGTLLTTNVLFFLIAAWMDRRKTEVISKDSDINVSYTRAKKQLWNMLWKESSYLVSAMLVAIAVSYWFYEQFVFLLLVITCVSGVVQMVVIAGAFKKRAGIDRFYQDKRDPELLIDEDKNWIWGMYYYNPNDKRSMVDTRIGIGTTTNMASFLGKALCAVMIVVILFCFLMFGWVIFEEFTPIKLRLEGEYVEAVHTGVEYRIETSHIQSATLIDELPRMSKTRGTSMDTLMKGSFWVSAEKKKCKVFLNPENTCFIRIETDDWIYYLGGFDDRQTKEIYHQLSR